LQSIVNHFQLTSPDEFPLLWCVDFVKNTTTSKSEWLLMETNCARIGLSDIEQNTDLPNLLQHVASVLLKDNK
jgi:hypothetical protein